jgi:hypothetical protein
MKTNYLSKVLSVALLLSIASTVPMASESGSRNFLARWYSNMPAMPGKGLVAKAQDMWSKVPSRKEVTDAATTQAVTAVSAVQAHPYIAAGVAVAGPVVAYAGTKAVQAVKQSRENAKANKAFVDSIDSNLLDEMSKTAAEIVAAIVKDANYCAEYGMSKIPGLFEIKALKQITGRVSDKLVDLKNAWIEFALVVASYDALENHALSMLALLHGKYVALNAEIEKLAELATPKKSAKKVTLRRPTAEEAGIATGMIGGAAGLSYAEYRTGLGGKMLNAVRNVDYTGLAKAAGTGMMNVYNVAQPAVSKFMRNHKTGLGLGAVATTLGGAAWYLYPKFKKQPVEQHVCNELCG